MKSIPPNRNRSYFQQSLIPMHEIQPQLYLGNIQAALNERFLAQHNIDSIVKCLQNPQEAPDFARIEYCYVPINDWANQNIVQHLPQALRFIHRRINSGHTVLVHCLAGISRSSSVVIAYLMARDGINFQIARQRVQQRRLIINPNIGFQNQLRAQNLEDLRRFLN